MLLSPMQKSVRLTGTEQKPELDEGSNNMAASRFRCTVLEISGDHGDSADVLAQGPREILPWADPFIAQLVAKHRLRAALDDSLDFLRNDASLPSLPEPRMPLKRQPSSRFAPPLDDVSPADVEGWPW